MSKLAISLLISLTASLAFAQEAPVAAGTTTQEASPSAAVVTKTAPGVDTNSTAFKVGSWLGKIATPVSTMGKSFLAGLTQDATKKETSEEKAAEVTPEAKEVPASKVPVVDIPVAKSSETDAEPSGLSGVRARVAGLLAIAKQKQKELNEAHAKSDPVTLVAAQ